VSAQTPLGTIRRPVRREGAEGYLFLVLVSFAVTVIGTRWFLELTGFPQIGGGDLHVAHALWGGVALFVAAVLPIVLAGRLVYRAAAPIIYTTFLLAVIVWLRVRRPHDPEPRAQLLGALELLEESVEGDLQRDEVRALTDRLRAAADRAPAAEQRRLAVHLLAFVNADELRIAPDPVDRLGSLRAGWRARADRWLGGRGLRVVIVAALLLTGIVQVWSLLSIAAGLRLDPSQPLSALDRFQLIHLGVEAVAGALVLAGGMLVAVVGRHGLGWTLAYLGLLVTITLGDLIGFYVRQFDSIVIVLGHLVLLAAVVGYRDRLRAETG
jgi:hypothetical protein